MPEDLGAAVAVRPVPGESCAVAGVRAGLAAWPLTWGCRRLPESHRAMPWGIRPPWTGAWTGCRGIPSTVSAACAIGGGISAVQAPAARTVLMVRRRSTVRFRNGAPAQGQFSNGSEGRCTESWRRASALIAAKAPIAQPEPGRQLLKVAVGGPSRDGLVTVRARSRWVGRPGAGRFQDPMSRIKILGASGGCLVIRLAVRHR